MTSIEVGQIVRIRDNALAWRVVAIKGLIAVLESGQTLRRREELLENLRDWKSTFRG